MVKEFLPTRVFYEPDVFKLSFWKRYGPTRKLMELTAAELGKRAPSGWPSDLLMGSMGIENTFTNRKIWKS